MAIAEIESKSKLKTKKSHAIVNPQMAADFADSTSLQEIL
jgi:hypothetical protein